MTRTRKTRQHIPDNLTAAAQLVRALDRFSKGNVPDYISFRSWLAKKLKSQSQKVPVSDALGARHSFAASVANELTRLTQAMRQHKEMNIVPSARDFLRLKLLMSFLSQSKRGEDFLSTILRSDDLEESGLTADLSSASPAQLRLRLFAAMHRDRGHDAFMILGRIEERDLDLGEYSFLRSICHFRAGQFHEAVEYSGRVPLSAPDGPRAVEIRAKSHAYLGDGPSVQKAIDSLAKDALTTCQVLLLAELTAYHSASPKDALIPIMSHPLLAGGITISADDAGFGEFQKFHVQLLTAYVERAMEIEESLAAKDGSSATAPDLSSIISNDPILQRSIVAVAFEPRLKNSLNNSPSLSAIFLDSLGPSISEGDREALQIFFKSLYRLRAYDEFMTHFNAIWPKFMSDASWLDVLGLGYQVATILAHPSANELRQKIDALDAKDMRLNAEEIAHRQLIGSRLTSMGQEAYRVACNAIDAAGSEDMLWRDSGLLALGFFRILEIEINARFILPVAASIDLARLETCIANSTNDAAKPWNSAVKSLKSIIIDPSKQLMLGPLRKMCNDVASPPPHLDGNLRALIQSAFESQLTQTGRAAFYSGRLTNTISSERVNTFRNPPAHGRFVSISDARSCHDFVNASLEEYFTWFVDYAA